MQQRVSKLEEQVTTLVVDVAVIKSNYATRQNVEELRGEMHKSMAGLRDEMRTSMSELRDEMRTSMSELRDEMRTSMSGLKDEMYKAMASQTRWLFSAIFIALGAGLSVAKLMF